MEYGKLERELIELCREYPPDFDAIHAKIAEGADVNAGDVYSNIVSEIIYNYGWIYDSSDGSVHKANSGEYLPAIVKILLDAGFDVSHCDGAYGGDALWNLIFSPACKACFKVAEMLLKAGANPRYIPPDECDDVIEAVRYDGLFTMHETLMYGGSQESLSSGEFIYRLYIFMRDWPETTVDRCLVCWPKMKFEEWKHKWPLNLENYLFDATMENEM